MQNLKYYYFEKGGREKLSGKSPQKAFKTLVIYIHTHTHTHTHTHSFFKLDDGFTDV